MDRPSATTSFFVLGTAGCLLPFLTVVNLFFGWLFLRPRVWLLIQLVLFLLLLVNSYFLKRRISRLRRQQEKIIDTDAEILE